MKNYFVFITLALILITATVFSSCTATDKPEVTIATDTASSETTEADVTVAETTAEEITEADEVTTVEDTTAAEITAEETTVDSNDPVLNLIKVGKSPNGKYDCYDGRYDFGDTLGTVTCDSKGSRFSSFQEAVDELVENGGGATGIDPQGADFGICVSLTIPDDGKNYIIYYNYANIDFVFNIGVTFDGGIEEGMEVPGYAYYSNFEVLDRESGLDGCHILVWSQVEGLAPGYYKMTEHDAPAGESRYTYELDGTLEEKWVGLYLGETYFENLE